MLPTEHNQQYKKLSLLLNQLQQIVAQENLELPKILARCQEVQQLFSNKIISLDNSELNPSVASRVQSYQTEIHKQLRLLNMDITFLQASRNPQTTKTRLATLGDRLETLRGYCLTILGHQTQAGDG